MKQQILKEINGQWLPFEEEVEDTQLPVQPTPTPRTVADIEADLQRLLAELKEVTNGNKDQHP